MTPVNEMQKALEADGEKLQAMTALFPIILRSSDIYGGGDRAYMPYYLKHKPKQLTWYGYDTIIHSPVDLEFVVYSMLDNFTGGLGPEIRRFKITVPSDLTKYDVDRAAMRTATLRRERELREAEDAIISSYAEEILLALRGAA